MKNTNLNTLLLLLFLWGNTLYANITPTKEEYYKIHGYENIESPFNIFSTHLSIGTISGEANEYVYFPEESRTVSQLIWDIDSLQMFDIGFSLDLEIIKLNTDLWFSIKDGNSYLVDYDWMTKDLDWTDRSLHTDTNIIDAMIFDINVELHAYTFNQDSILSVLLGYKQESYTWEARGGTFIYSHDDYRDISGKFKDGLLGITYEQIWSVPYVGIKFNSTIDKITFNSQVQYSPFASGEMTDLHHLRNIEAIDTFKETNMLGITIGVDYTLSSQYAIGLDYSYQHYKNSVGDSEWHENDNVNYLEDYVGADLETSMLSIHFKYTF